MSNWRHTKEDHSLKKELSNLRAESARKFQTKLDNIFDKYSSVAPEGHDVIDMATLEIVEEYGDIRNMKRIPIGSYVSHEKEGKYFNPSRTIYRTRGKEKSGHHSISLQKAVQQDLLEKTTEKLMNLELTERKKKIFHKKKKVCRSNHISRNATLEETDMKNNLQIINYLFIHNSHSLANLLSKTPTSNKAFDLNQKMSTDSIKAIGKETTVHTPLCKKCITLKPTFLKDDLQMDDINSLNNSLNELNQMNEQKELCDLNHTKCTDGCSTPVLKQKVSSLKPSPFTSTVNTMKPTSPRDRLKINDVYRMVSPSNENSSISGTPPSDKHKVCHLHQTKSTDGCSTPVYKQRIPRSRIELFTPKDKEVDDPFNKQETPKTCITCNSDQKKSPNDLQKQKFLSLAMKPPVLTPKGFELDDLYKMELKKDF